MYTFYGKLYHTRIETTYLCVFSFNYILLSIRATGFESNRVSHDRINVKKFFSKTN